MLNAIILILSIIGNSSFEDQLEALLNKEFSTYDNIEFSLVTDVRQYREIIIPDNYTFNRYGNNGYLQVKAVGPSGSKTEIINLRIKLYKFVLVSSEIIGKQKPVNSLNTVLALKEISELRFTPATEIQSGQYQARTEIKSGEIILKENIERIPLINAGDPIDAIFNEGSVTISMNGVARQSGIENEIIRIKANNNQYKARIIENGLVQIVE